MIPIRTLQQLRELRGRLVSLPTVRNRIAQRVAEDFSKRAKAAFDAQKSPDGTPWKPGKGGKRLTRHKSGRLEQAATTFTANGRGVRVSALTVPYARYQRPRNFIPATLPPEWSDSVKQIASEEISAHLRGAR